MRTRLAHLYLITFFILFSGLITLEAQSWERVNSLDTTQYNYRNYRVNRFSQHPYCGYFDVANRFIVKKFNGTEWETVGTSLITDIPVYNYSISVDQEGTPYVLYYDISHNGYLKKFNGTEWETVGNNNFNNGSVVNQIEFDSTGYPYVLLLGTTMDELDVVLKYDGTTWHYLGEPGFFGGWLDGHSLSVSPSGVPYVSHIVHAYSQGKLQIGIKKFNGANWVDVGDAIYSSDGWHTISDDYRTSITFDNSGTPFLAFISMDSSQSIYVKKLVNSKWVDVGTRIDGGFSTVQMIIDENNKKYLISTLADSSEICVFKFNDVLWKSLGNCHIRSNYLSLFINDDKRISLLYRVTDSTYKGEKINSLNLLTYSFLPRLNTLPVSDITSHGAVCNGNLYYYEDSPVTDQGFCWNTAGNPTIADAHTSEPGMFLTGDFSANLTGLALGTKYYVRAYATNSVGTGYGHEISFTTYNPENVSKMSFQGLLTDNSGKLLNDGNYSITFKLYDALTGGTQIWSETQTVAVARGMVNVNLGAANPIDAVKFNTSYWLGITVGNGSELSPRTAITGSAYPVGSVGK